MTDTPWIPINVIDTRWVKLGVDHRGFGLTIAGWCLAVNWALTRIVLATHKAFHLWQEGKCTTCRLR